MPCPAVKVQQALHQAYFVTVSIPNKMLSTCSHTGLLSSDFTGFNRLKVTSDQQDRKRKARFLTGSSRLLLEGYTFLQRQQ